jgi:hypothetical protein
MQARQFKLLYAAASLFWLIYSSERLFAAHAANHTPISGGTLLCLLLFVSIPALGYMLLFRLFPWASRLRKR